MKTKNIRIILKDTYIDVVINYKKVKNITLKIRLNKVVEIVVPYKTDDKIIEKILHEKSAWILNKIRLDIKNDYIQREYKHGEAFMYLGNEYKLKIIESKNIIKNKPSIFIDKDYLIYECNTLEKINIKSDIKSWYKTQSEEIVSDRLKMYMNKLDILPSKVMVKEQKRILGSCTSTRNIYINSKISMAPIFVIDYVIVHELSHLVHMNHSKDFYNLVSLIYKDYKKSIEWIKKEGYKISL